jgi:dihydrofolate reductase
MAGNLTIIVATDQNGLMGRSDTNALPWYVADDLKLFRQRTLGHAVIMGRKTWDSLPKRPLSQRYNIVVTRQVFEACIEAVKRDDDVIAYRCGSLRYAVALAQDHYYYAQQDRSKEIFLIGGAELYREALKANLVNKVVMSKIVGQFEGDIYFPHLPADQWEGEVVALYKDFEVWNYKKKPPALY